MYQPPVYVYKQHPWRRPKAQTEAGFIFGQVDSSGEGFYVRDFIRIYQQHLAFVGRPVQRKDTIRGKLRYHYQNGYLIRRIAADEGSGWKEMLADGTEIPVLPAPPASSSYSAPSYSPQYLPPGEKSFLNGEETPEQRAAADAEFERILATMPDRFSPDGKPLPSSKVEQQLSPAESPQQLAEDLLRELGYLRKKQ